MIQLAPKVGGPLPPIGLPLWPISVAPSRKMLPTASLTPGTARTVASSEVGTGWFWPPPMPPESPAIGRPCTVTATPAFAVAKMLVNVALIVSVRMNVPATNDTPRMTAIVVSASRSLCESRLRRLIPIMRQRRRWRSVTEMTHDVEHAVGRRSVHLADDATVGEEHDAIRVRGGERDRG